VDGVGRWADPKLDPRALVARYRAKHGIPAEAEVTPAMVLRHWELEKALRRDLLAASRERRWEVFERGYSRLYREIEWINRLAGTANPERRATDHDLWADLLGPPPLRVYEVGSGAARLISALARRGYRCTGTEITRERGQQRAVQHPNLSWSNSDGVHLERFEPANSYDAVISDQVVEHLHPGDLLDHLRGVRAILRPGGRYIVRTPHPAVGPSDGSRLFDAPDPRGIHLKEYTYRELAGALRQAGFRRVHAPLVLPYYLTGRLGVRLRPIHRGPYLPYLMLLERLLIRLPNQRLRRRVAAWLRFALFRGNMILIADA
jgi:SAM-dependent methyltransferase